MAKNTPYVKIIDMGYEAMMSRLSTLENLEVRVGILEGVEGERGLSVAELGAVNEFGSVKAGVPERSFLRSGFDDAQDELWDNIVQAKDDVMMGRTTARTAGKHLGEMMQDAVREKIGTVGPANAPSTIARKGFDMPLIESGRLKRSISYRVGTLLGRSLKLRSFVAKSVKGNEAGGHRWRWK